MRYFKYYYKYRSSSNKPIFEFASCSIQLTWVWRISYWLYFSVRHFGWSTSKIVLTVDWRSFWTWMMFDMMIVSDLTHSDEINWLYGFCSVFLKWVNVSLRSSDRNCLVNHSVDNLQYASQNCSHQHSWEQHLQCKLYVSTSNLVVAWKPPLELKMVNFRSSKLWIMPNLSITAGCKVYEICWFRNSFQLDSILVTVRPQKRIW